MIRTILFALATACVAAPSASALSCLAPSPETTLSYLDVATDKPVLAVGDIDFHFGDPSPVPVDNMNAEHAGTEALGFFSGTLYDADGAVEVFNLLIKARIDCAGPWCGGYGEPSEDAAQFFVFKTEATSNGAMFVLPLGACGGTIFPVPTDERITSLQSLLKES